MLLPALVVKIKATCKRNCFVSLPQNLVKEISFLDSATFCLENQSGRKCYVSWAHDVWDEKKTIADNCSTILLDEMFMIENDLCNDDEFVMTQIEPIVPYEDISVKINTLVEWDTLTLNIDVAQTEFLDQVRVVYPNEIIPLRLTAGAIVHLSIKTTSPKINYGLLMPSVKVNIIPPSTSDSEEVVINPTSGNTVQSIDTSTVTDIDKVKLIDNASIFGQSVVTNLVRMNTHNVYTPPPVIKLRLKVFSMPSDTKPNSLSHFVIVSKKTLMNTYYQNRSKMLVQIFPEGRNGEKNNQAAAESSKSLNTIAIIWENFKIEKGIVDSSFDSEIEHLLSNNMIMIPNQMRINYGIRLQSVICFETGRFKTSNQPLDIDVIPSRSVDATEKEDIFKSVQDYFNQITSVIDCIVQSRFVEQLNINGNKVNVMFIPRTDSLLITRHSVNLLKITIRNQVDFPNLLSLKSLDERKTDDKSKFVILRESVQKLQCKIVSHLLRQLKLTKFSLAQTSFTVIEGAADNGKSTLTKFITKELSSAPHYVHCITISCREKKGKKAEVFEKCLSEAFSAAFSKAPSLICLEDLDSICPMLKKDNLNFDYHMQLVTVVNQFLNKIHILNNSSLSSTSITVLITCLERLNVDEKIVSLEHSPYFGKTYCIPTIRTDEKLTVLSEILNQHANKKGVSIDSSEVKKLLEPFTLSDLKHLAMRTITRVESDNSKKSSSSISAADVLASSEGYIPIAHKDTSNRNDSSQLHVGDVGGLDSQIQTLKESICWPAQYPQLFECVKNTQLRLLSGILLYGPPGCGKTKLAHNIAKMAGVNIVAVKGPELLSKYIGQSEENVREVFERAANCSPCILFFDEFDSLAPPRGRDSTGVSDRVVNQLLTQLDGVEDRGGTVWVLAATCRPDLIDSALLRPGRLEKLIYLPLPEESDREKILETLSHQYQFTDSIDWLKVAAMTPNLSGADLQALLSTARMYAVKECIGEMSLYAELGEDSEHTQMNLSDNIERKIEEKDPYSRISAQKPKKELSNQANNSVPLISESHIFSAIKETKPSVSEADRLRYLRLRDTFSGLKKEAPLIPGQKTTLA